MAFSGFNPDYVVAIGDRISVRMWGAFTFEAAQVVDAQGNIFIPNVGPVRVLGVRNADLNQQVESAGQAHLPLQRRRLRHARGGAAGQGLRHRLRSRRPGLYGGLSSDSVLYYLDRAGGIDPDRGSYLAGRRAARRPAARRASTCTASCSTARSSRCSCRTATPSSRRRAGTPCRSAARC